MRRGVLVLAAVLAACVPGRSPFGPPAPVRETEFVFRNANWSRAEFGVLCDQRRLLPVRAETGRSVTRTYDLTTCRRTRVSVELLANAGSITLGPVPPSPGAVVIVQVENALHQSWYRVR